MKLMLEKYRLLPITVDSHFGEYLWVGVGMWRTIAAFLDFYDANTGKQEISIPPRSLIRKKIARKKQI